MKYRRVPRNFYEGKARNHHIVEGEISGLVVAISLLKEQIKDLQAEHEAGVAAANDMTVAQYRDSVDRAEAILRSVEAVSK